MKANQAMYPIATMCRVLGVSTSGYYVWLKREPSRRAQEDAVLSDRIEVIHKTSRQTYGAPRVWHELKDDGVRIGCKRVARLMRRHSLRGVSRRRGMRTTLRKEPIRSDRDRVDRTSPHHARTHCGSLTSPTSRPGPGSCIWPWSWMSSADGSSVGPCGVK